MQVQQHVSKLEVLVLVHVQDTERKIVFWSELLIPGTSNQIASSIM